MAEYTTLLGMLCGASDNEDENPPIKVEPLHLKTISHCLHNLVDNQRRSIGEIAEIFQIDKESRRKFGNELVKYQQDEYENEEDNGEEGEEGETPLDESSIDDLFRINKALSLEKLTNYFMYQSDSPAYSRSHCLMHKASGLPCNHAPPRMPDGIIDYGDFKVCLEVTAKTNMSQEYFIKQLEGGLKHIKDTDCNILMLVSEWGPEDSRAAQTLEVIRKRYPKELEDIDLIPISIKTLSGIGSKLGNDFEFINGRKPIAAETMRAVFSALTMTTFQFDKKKEKKTQEAIWRDELAKGWNKAVITSKRKPPSPK